MNRVLITGINGFAGSHLAEYLIKNNLAEVSGTILNASMSTENLNEVLNKTKIIVCDITKQEEIENAVSQSQPDIIFHLAAIAFVPESIKHPTETFNTNFLGTLNVFEAARKLVPNAIVHIASSGEVYGAPTEKELPLRETNPLRPLNPYAVSKASCDLLAFQYFKMFGLKTIVTRAFNHTGPKQADSFVVSNWAKQIAQIEKGTHEAMLSTGDLRNARDFTDVRDIVRAYWLVATKGKPGEVYNVCSGKAITLKQLFSMFARQAKKKISVKIDETKIRKNDIRTVKASFAKLKSVTDWKPEIPLQKTVSDTLEYWRKKI